MDFTQNNIATDGSRDITNLIVTIANLVAVPIFTISGLYLAVKTTTASKASGSSATATLAKKLTKWVLIQSVLLVGVVVRTYLFYDGFYGKLHYPDRTIQSFTFCYGL